VFTGSISLGRAANSTVGTSSVAEGYNATASGAYAHAEGNETTASGSQSHAEGSNTTASGANAHAEGAVTIASGPQSHAEGVGGTFTLDGTTYTSDAKGTADHTEGYRTLTAMSQPGNHAEGYQTMATGGAAHSEGSNTIASGNASHAEGGTTTASGLNSHAEGMLTIASGGYGHAEGSYTEAKQYNSHAEGYNTIAAGTNSHVSGMYNISDSYGNWPEWTANTSYSVGDKVKRTNTSNNQTTVTGYVCKTANNDSSFTASKWTSQDGKMNFAEIIGNGTADNARSNARTLDWDGNERLKGDIYVGCNGDSTGGTKLTVPVGMTGADGTNAGTAGYVPAPAATDNTKFLKGNGTWATVDALPTVTSSDNGKILRVVSGVWEAVSLPSASGVSF